MYNSKGFTLLETVVALALASMIMLTGIFLLSTFFRTFNLETKQAYTRQLHQKILTEISENIRSAKKASVIGNKLTLTFPNYTLSYEYSSGKIKRQKGNSTAYLTDVNEIKSLDFQSLAQRLIEIKTEIFTTEAFCRNE